MTESTNHALVNVDGVEKVFHRGSEDIHVLKDLHLKVPAGEFLALMGPSGSGKSTLLNLIGGLDRPTRGWVSIAGERVDYLSDRKLAVWRARHIGFVFQLYNLLPVLTGRAERGITTVAHTPVQGAAETTCRDRVGNRRAGAARATFPAPAFRRGATARRHRARDCHRSDLAALRRAHR